MFFLWLFNTAGLIFGPLIVLAGIVAMILCLRATRRSDSAALGRKALLGSLAPFVVGICGAIFGLLFVLISGPAGGIQSEHYLNLGKVILAGLVVTAVPLIWSLMLVTRPRATA